MKPFEHGGDIASFAKRCGCKEEEVIDLSSNINTIKPHIDVDFNALEIAPYPNYEKLYESIASHYEVEVAQMELFNGASVAIFSLFSYLKTTPTPPKSVTLYAPAYLEYKKASQIFGYPLHLIDRFSKLEAEVEEGSLVVFVNPSTPDGYCYDIEALLQKWQEKKCTILVDESFLAFTSLPSVVHHIKKYDKLYVLKSMTKFYGAAGIRIGALISNNININALHQREPAWKISSFDSAYIQEALKDESLFERTKTSLEAVKTSLVEVLERSLEIEHIYPTHANYLLVKLSTLTADTFQAKLTPYHILVRNCANFDGLDDSYVRIAIKDALSVAQLKKALNV